MTIHSLLAAALLYGRLSHTQDMSDKEMLPPEAHLLQITFAIVRLCEVVRMRSLACAAWDQVRQVVGRQRQL